MRPRRLEIAGDRGAALVEAAIVVPVLLLIMLGTITGGITLSRQNSVENAVRESTRLGAVYPLDEPDVAAYLAAVLAETEASATGDLDDGVAGKRICVAFINGDGGASRLVKTNSGTSSGSGSCFADGRSEARVQVEARRTSEIQAVLYAQSVTIDARSVTRYER